MIIPDGFTGPFKYNFDEGVIKDDFNLIVLECQYKELGEYMADFLSQQYEHSIEGMRSKIYDNRFIFIHRRT